MWPVPIVHVGPAGQVGGPLIGCLIGSGIGPFAQGGLDEALGLAVGSGRIRLCSDVLQTERFAGARDV